MKYTAIFLKKTGNSEKNPNYEKVGKKDFKSIDETIEFKDKDSFKTHTDFFAYQDDKTKYYFYDFDNGDLINFDTLIKSGIIPKDLSKFTGRKTLEAIIAGAKANMNSSLLMMILPIITLIIGIVVGHFVAPSIVTVPVAVNTVPSPGV